MRGLWVWVCPDAGGKSVGFFILRIGGICNPILLPTQRHLSSVYSEHYRLLPAIRTINLVAKFNLIIVLFSEMMSLEYGVKVDICREQRVQTPAVGHRRWSTNTMGPGLRLLDQRTDS